MDRLIPLIAKLQELLGVVGKLNLGQTVDLPQIVVVGSQRHSLALHSTALLSLYGQSLVAPSRCQHAHGASAIFADSFTRLLSSRSAGKSSVLESIVSLPKARPWQSPPSLNLALPAPGR